MNVISFQRCLKLFLAVILGLFVFSMELPIGAFASSNPGIPPDLATGWVYSKTIPLISQPVQAVYAPMTGQIATLNSSGNLSLYTEAGSTLMADQTFLENDPQNFGPNLVSNPKTSALYWINMSTNNIETLNLTAAKPQVTVLAHDPNLPEYLTAGPSGRHLYVVDQGTSGNGDIGQLSLADPSAGFSSVALSLPADAPAAVYETSTGPMAFVPSALSSRLSGTGGSILRISFSGTPKTLSALADASIPSGVSVTPSGWLAVSQALSNTLNLVAQATQATPQWLAPTAPPDAISSLPGQLQVGTRDQISVLGTNAASNPVWMVYHSTRGTWTTPTVGAPQGPLSASDGVVVSPTTGTQLAVLSPSGATLFTLAQTLPPPLYAPSVQMAVSATGTLWIPNQSGAAALSPQNGSLQSTVSTTYAPSGGLALTAAGAPILTTSNPPGIFEAASNLLTATPDTSTPIALSTASSGTWSLNQASTGTELWNVGSGTLVPLSYNANSLANTSAGPVAAGSEQLDFLSRKTVLSNSAFVGPMTLSADGSLLYNTRALGASVEVTDVATASLLGSVPLPDPVLGPGQSLSSITGLAQSPRGSRLYALTANAIVVYQGPHLTLTARSLDPSVGTQDAITATLINSEGAPVAGQSIQLQGVSKEVTNASGQTSFSLAITTAGVLSVQASTPGALASLKLDATKASPRPTPAPPPTNLPKPSSPPNSTTTPPSLPAPRPPSSPPSAPSRPAPKPYRVPWLVQLRHPPHHPPLHLAWHPSGQTAPTPGPVIHTFRVSAGKERLYPGNFRIEVIAPPKFKGHYSLWYFSRPAWRWYPILPVKVTYRTFTANVPFLTTMAIMRQPHPPSPAITVSTWINLATTVADLTHPSGTPRARVVPLMAYRWGKHPISNSITVPTFLAGRPAGNIDLAAALARMDAIHVVLDDGWWWSLRRLNRLLLRRGFITTSSGAMAEPVVTDESRDRSKIVGPTLIFDQHAWSPEGLTRLRQLNLELAPPSSSQLPLKSAVSHQLSLIRRLNLAHPIVDARQYQWQITHRDGHGIVMGVGSHPAMLSMLGGELAFSYHAMVVLGLSARAWHAFDLGFIPSFVVNLTRRPVQRRAQSIPVNRQRHRPPGQCSLG